MSEPTPPLEVPTDPQFDLPTLAAGTVLGHYVILERLDRGGMGVVYLGYDGRLDRRIAIKLMATGAKDSALYARTLREARALAALDHANVLAVHDIGEFGQALWMATDYIDGESLRRWRARCRPDWRIVFGVMRQALEGLAAAHRSGLVHRDFKPDNAMIDASGRVRVIDFGLVASDTNQDLQTARRDEGASDHATWRPGLTRAGTRMGTPGYAAPEQWAGSNADVRSDLYAWAASTVELLTGELPYGPRSDLAPDEPAFAAGRLLRHEVPPALAARLAGLLAIDPTQRPADAAQVLAAIDGALTPRRRGRVLATLSLLALLAGSAYWLAGREERLCAQEDPRLDAASVTVGAVAEQLRSGPWPFATQAADAVQAVMSDWQREWSGARRAACRATHIQGEQSAQVLDLQTICLDQRWAEASALLRRLEQADEALAARAAQAVEGLPRPRACLARDRLLERVERPHAPAAVAALGDLEQGLAEVQADFLAGRYEAIRSAETRLRALALDAEWPPAQAELAFQLARAHDDGNDFQAARAAYRESFAAALAGRDAERALLAAGHLAATLAAKAQDREGALEWLALARSVHRGIAAVDERLTLALRLDETRLLQSLGRFDEAAPLADEAVALARRHADEGGRYLLLRALSNQGNNAIYLGQHELAARIYEEVLATTERVLGRGHPRFGLLLGNAGEIAAAIGDWPRAIALGEQALELARAHFGEGHWETMVAWHNLAARLDAAGRDEEALAAYRQALAAGEAAVGPDHPQLAHVHAGLASLLAERGASAESIAAAQRALALLSAPDADGALRVQSHLALARAHRDRGESALSQQHLRIASAQLEAVAEPALRERYRNEIERLDRNADQPSRAPR